MTEFRVPTPGQLNPKTAHLVILKDKLGSGKGSHNRCFVSLDLPNMGGVSFIQAKGFFSEESAEVITGKFREMISTLDKDIIKEVYMPWGNIERVESLVYVAK